jgi:hypothetical protein
MGRLPRDLLASGRLRVPVFVTVAFDVDFVDVPFVRR